MIWDYFIYFAIAAIVLWCVGAWASWQKRFTLACTTTLAGILIFLVYIVIMWVALQRPPMRTMGETRLWYSLFLPMTGMVVYGRWRYRWILPLTAIMAIVFVGINLLRPEIHSKALMPALQSPWFAPHVIAYMIAYALMGAATLIAIYELAFRKKTASGTSGQSKDDLVCAGLALLTLGMLMGALWAKEAWGHYWAWDPKETWAAVTWLSYLAYLHLARYDKQHQRLACWMLIVSFCLLQMCWWGINYLPSAQATSVHTYSMQ